MRIEKLGWDLRALMVGAAALVPGAGVGRGATVSYPMSFSTIQKDLFYDDRGNTFYGFIDAAISFNRFDLSLGILKGLTISGRLNCSVDFLASDSQSEASADVSVGGQLLNYTGFRFSNPFPSSDGTVNVSTTSGIASRYGHIDLTSYITQPGFANLQQDPYAVQNVYLFPFIGSGPNTERPWLNPDPTVGVDLKNVVNVKSATLTLFGTDDAEVGSSLSVTYEYTPVVPEPSAALGGVGLMAVMAASRLRRRR